MREKNTTKQLINAELAARSFNTKAKELIKNHSPKKEQSELIVAFHCECSNEKCSERVPLTLKQYEQIHKTEAHFVLVPGHNEPRVEKVTAKTDAFVIVKKPALQNK